MEHIKGPKFSPNSTVELKGGYSFKIEEIISREIGVYRYRGQMLKNGKKHSYGTASEQLLDEHV